MKNIIILVPESPVLQAIADPQYCFGAVNQFLEISGHKPLFEIKLAGLSREVKLVNGNYSVFPDLLIHEVEEADLIVIPALFGEMEMAVEANRGFIPWLISRHEQGTELASLCVGAFLLAATGLLDGKGCSTHWGFVNEFRNRYPEVSLRDGSIVTEENRIYTSGGANSYWNLLLHLVEKYTDRQTAILASKYFAIDIDRHSQAAFALFRGQKAHKDEAVRIAQEYIEKNYESRITVEKLAEEVALGRRSLERRFRKATSNTVIEYVQRVKIEAAKRNLETGNRNIHEVMYHVGYNDTKAFRSAFKKITGLTPLEYRNKYFRG